MKLAMYAGFNALAIQLGPAAAVAKAKELGFDGIELLDAASLYTDEFIAQVKDALKENEMTACCYSAFATLTGPQAEATEQRLLRCAEYCAALNIPYLHHTLIGLFCPPPATCEFAPGAFEEVVERAGRVAAYAASLGVACIYEDQGFYFNGTDRMRRFFQAMDAHNPGFCADLGNCLFVDEEPQTLIDAFRDRVRHVHIKDFYRFAQPPADSEPILRSFGGMWLFDALPGKGCIDIPGCLRKLSDFYDGFYSLEYWPGTLSDSDGAALVKWLRSLC